MEKLSILLLCGGKGLRLGGEIPKQYLPLGDKPIAVHSFDLFAPYGERIVVAREEWRGLFKGEGVKFASPGERRQDSVYNGLKEASGDWILVHDAARPFISKTEVDALLEAAESVGAAALGNPVRFTVKEIDPDHLVVNTPDRAFFWEIQTPQLIRRDVLEQGFSLANRQGLTVTDDVSLAELTGAPVKMILGHPNNFKITTTQDLSLAKWMWECTPTN